MIGHHQIREHRPHSKLHYRLSELVVFLVYQDARGDVSIHLRHAAWSHLLPDALHQNSGWSAHGFPPDYRADREHLVAVL